MQTNTNKLLAGAMVAGMIFTGTAQAATIIGSGTVAGSGALTTDVTWNIVSLEQLLVLSMVS